MIDLQQLKATLQEYQVIVCFSGEFSQGVIEELSDAIKSHFYRDDLPKNDYSNVLSVFVEQAQNIINYNNKHQDYPYGKQIAESGIVTVGTSGNGYFVASGNMVTVQDTAELCSRLDHVNSLDKDALKRLYKDTMKSSPIEGSTGAGLGLILMARKAKAPLEYRISRPVDDLAYFSVSVKL